MDARNNMLIAKGKIVTSDVIECSLNSETQRWDITFSNGKEYHYSINAVVWLRNPKSLDPKAYQIHFRGRPLNGIESIFVFTHEPDEFWHICFSDGCERSYGRKELDIQHSCLENANARQVFDYLGKIAGQVSVRTEDDTAILQKQYEKIDFLSDDRAVAVYLNPAEYKASCKIDINGENIRVLYYFASRQGSTRSDTLWKFSGPKPYKFVTDIESIVYINHYDTICLDANYDSSFEPDFCGVPLSRGRGSLQKDSPGQPQQDSAGRIC